jgi:hypothetical protein
MDRQDINNDKRRRTHTKISNKKQHTKKHKKQFAGWFARKIQ